MIIVRFMVVSVFSTRIPSQSHYAPYITVQLAGQCTGSTGNISAVHPVINSHLQLQKRLASVLVPLAHGDSPSRTRTHIHITSSPVV